MGELGSLIAAEILETFKETFRDRDFSSSVVKGTMYSSFSYKLYDCINNTLRTIVINCAPLCLVDPTWNFPVMLLTSFSSSCNLSEQYNNRKESTQHYLYLMMERKQSQRESLQIRYRCLQTSRLCRRLQTKHVRFSIPTNLLVYNVEI